MNITKIQLDGIREIINIGIGRAANILNKMFEARIKLNVPEVDIVKYDEIISHLDDGKNESVSSVNLSFKGQFSGMSKLIFPTDSAAKLVTAFVEEDTEEDDMDEIRSATLAEIGNIVLNSLMGSIGNILKLKISYTTPNYFEDKIENLLNLRNLELEPVTLLAKTSFLMENLNIRGDFVLLFEIGSLKEFLLNVDYYAESQN
jgi:chemotaxis protein CheC